MTNQGWLEMNQNGTSRFSRFGLKRSGLFTLQTSATEYCLAIAYSKTIHHKNCTIQEQHTNYFNWLLQNRFVQQNSSRQIIDELLQRIKTFNQVHKQYTLRTVKLQFCALQRMSFSLHKLSFSDQLNASYFLFLYV